MNRNKTWALVTVAAVFAAGILAGAVLAQGGKSPVLWPAGDLKWVDSPGVPGAKIAVLWGDPKTGGYGALKKIGGGATLAEHTHSSDQRVICVAGTISITVEGGAAKDVGPGSYMFMPAGVKHTAACKAGADCVYFEEQPAASDIKYVGGAPPKK